MHSVPAASSMTAAQTVPTSVDSGSRHAVTFGSAPTFDPAAKNAVTMPQSTPSSVAANSSHDVGSGSAHVPPLRSHQVMLLGHLQPIHPWTKALHLHPRQVITYANAYQ